MSRLETDDMIELPVPDVALERITREAIVMPAKRELHQLSLGDVDLGAWRVERVRSEMHNGYPRLLAVLRRVYP